MIYALYLLNFVRYHFAAQNDVGGSWSRVQKTAEEKGDKGSVSYCVWVAKSHIVF